MVVSQNIKIYEHSSSNWYAVYLQLLCKKRYLAMKNVKSIFASYLYKKYYDLKSKSANFLIKQFTIPKSLNAKDWFL